MTGKSWGLEWKVGSVRPGNGPVTEDDRDRKTVYVLQKRKSGSDKKSHLSPWQKQAGVSAQALRRACKLVWAVRDHRGSHTEQGHVQAESGLR